MRMKLASAYGPAEIGNWLGETAQDTCGEREGIKRSRRGQEDLRARLVTTRQSGLGGASLLGLQAELQQDEKQEFWVTVILCAASWGGLSAAVCLTKPGMHRESAKTTVYIRQ